jgi:hypothetical protein
MPTQSAILAKPVPGVSTTGTKTLLPSGQAIPSEHVPNLNYDAIQHRAYQKWEAAGRPTGDGVNFWLEAESELSHTTCS